MEKRSYFKCVVMVVMSVLSLLVLTQPTPADLMKIDCSIGLSIPSNSRTTKSSIAEYWLTTAAGYYPDTSDIFSYSTFSQTFIFDKESLILSFDILMETSLDDTDTDAFTASLDGTTFYTPITNFRGNSFRGIASAPLYDLSSFTGKTTPLVSDLWYWLHYNIYHLGRCSCFNCPPQRCPSRQLLLDFFRLDTSTSSECYQLFTWLRFCDGEREQA